MSLTADARWDEKSSITAVKNSGIHGMGVFANQTIPARERIIEYVGEKITKEESVQRAEGGNVCLFSIDDTHDVDGNVPWNSARYINHSCAPNCEAVPVDGRIWIVSLREICSGEELTFNYGFDLVDYRQYPCHCGASECVGYIVAEAFFEHVRKHNQLSSGPELSPRIQLESVSS